MGPYNGSLKTFRDLAVAGRTRFRAPDRALFATLFPGRWRRLAPGHSLVLANPSYGEGDPRAWTISDMVGGSPGAMECFHPSPLRSVVINEMLAHSENPAVPQFVELYNHSTQSAWMFRAASSPTIPRPTNMSFRPAPPLVPAGFVSFNASLGFTLNPAGDTIYFIKPDGSRVLDAVQFEAQADGVSYGRWPDGANDFYPLQSPTPGTNNSAIADRRHRHQRTDVRPDQRQRR